MIKLIVVLLVALMFEAIGVVFLSKALKESTPPSVRTFTEVTKTVRAVATNGYFWLGLLLETCFFVGLLILLSQLDVSVVWPLTALGFVVTTLAAKLFLHENVSTIRWLGVVLIVAGAALVRWSEQPKTPDAAPQASTDSSLSPK